jgi:hypothetical protein
VSSSQLTQDPDRVRSFGGHNTELESELWKGYLDIRKGVLSRDSSVIAGSAFGPRLLQMFVKGIISLIAVIALQ